MFFLEMMRGRGGRPLNRTQLRAPFKTLKTHVAKPPFDLTMCENSFPRVNSVKDETLQSVSKYHDIEISYTRSAISVFQLSYVYRRLRRK